MFTSQLMVCVLCLAWCASAYSSSGKEKRDAGLGAKAGDDGGGGLIDCVSCVGDQTRFGEVMKAQKTAQRLEYIKQQLIAHLYIETSPKDLPKLNTLPEFLVEQLVNAQPEKSEIELIKEKHSETKQVVLFPDQEARDCHPVLKNSLCLSFEVSDEIMSNEVTSAVIWLRKAQYDGATIQNLTIADKSMVNTKNRNGRLKVYQVQESNGWYQVEVSSNVKPWQNHKDMKKRTLVISCDNCLTRLISNFEPHETNSFLLLNIEKEENSRSKRGVDCLPGNKECCRDNLEVDFKTLGDFRSVIYPTTFNAYMCRGNCYYHSAADASKPYASLLVMLKLNDTSEVQLPTTCCTPTKFSSLPVLFAVSNSTFEKMNIPNMVVESCGCI